MERLVIRGGRELFGELTVKAAKNSVLPLIACSILSREDVVLKNVPKLSDITHMLDIVKSIGGKAEFDGQDIYINCKEANSVLIESNLTGALRSSIFMLGPILSRFRFASIGLPGGCAIGERPIDLHLAGLEALGVKVCEENGYVQCDGSQIRGGTVSLRFPSVGATENIIMAATLGRKQTVIYNAAQEPEILDLQNFINSLGGKVSGAGTDTVTVEGVEKLHGGTYRPFTDRIVAASYLAVVAAAKGNIIIKDTAPESFSAVLEVFSCVGCDVTVGNDYVQLVSRKRLAAVAGLETRPYPGLPTDMQAQITAMLSMADGESTMVENVFENRFKYVEQLRTMGADITLNGCRAVIRGVKQLYGANVSAEDLRGGAALVIAALSAEGESEIRDIYHIDRGYDRIEDTLLLFGADVKRVT